MLGPVGTVSKSRDRIDRRTRQQKLPALAFGALFTQPFEAAVVEDRSAHGDRQQLMNGPIYTGHAEGITSLAASLPTIATSRPRSYFTDDACNPAEL